MEGLLFFMTQLYQEVIQLQQMNQQEFATLVHLREL